MLPCHLQRGDQSKVSGSDSSVPPRAPTLHRASVTKQRIKMTEPNTKGHRRYLLFSFEQDLSFLKELPKLVRQQKNSVKVVSKMKLNAMQHQSRFAVVAALSEWLNY